MDILRLNIDRDEPQASLSEIRLQVAFIAAIAAVVASLIARFAFGAPLVPELLAQFFFAVAPIWMVEAAVSLLGPFAKHLAFLGCVVVYLIALTAAAYAFLQIAPSTSLPARRVAQAAFALLIYLFTLILVIPLLGGGIAGRYLRQGALLTALALFIIHALYAVALFFAPRAYLDRGDANVAQSQLLRRRRIVRGIGYAVLAVGVYDIARSLLGSWLNAGAGRVHIGTGEFPDVNNLALEITPTKDFYV